jgi:hypothetical protein
LLPWLLETVAVKVTDCPYTDGFVEELSAVVVSILFTVSVAAFDVTGEPQEPVTTTS